MSIVTDKLTGYWHYKQGFEGNTWRNISPETKGRYNATVIGALLHPDGVYFDGVDDIAFVNGMHKGGGARTVEIVYKLKTLNSSQSVYFLVYDEDFGIMLYNLESMYKGYLIGVVYDSDYDFDEPILVGGMPDESVFVTITITRDNNLDSVFYINGVKVANSSFIPTDVDYLTDLSICGGNNYYYTGGLVKSVKSYDKALTPQEVAQNFAVGYENTGLTEESANTIPSATIISQSRNKISNITAVNSSIVKFKFDQDVTEWRVRTGGNSQDTGILADSGEIVKEGTEIQAEVDWTELSIEGANRINIYGKNNSGWTPYIANS